ncbi:MAG: pilin [Candidatus Vogelbacteria bacterium]
MSKWLNKLTLGVGIALLPVFVFAQSQESFKDFVDKIILLIFKPVTLLIGGLAVLYFLVGVLKYIQSADNEEKRKEGTMMMTYGIIALFVMVSLWGLVNVLKTTFGLNNTVISFPTTTP